MANNPDLTTALNNINGATFPDKGITTPINIDTKALTSAALSASSTKASPTTAGCDSAEQMKVWTGDIKGSGFTLKEVNPPKLPSWSLNNLPAKGTATTPTYGRGVNNCTGVGNANLNLSFNCNFVTGINLNSCLFKMEQMIELTGYRAVRLAWFEAAAWLGPFIDLIRQSIEFICRLLKQILKVICFIMGLVQCIISTIQAIAGIITWVMSLPARFIAFLMQCVTSFLNSIVQALGDMSKGLSSVFGGVTECTGFNCVQEEIKSVS